MIKINWLKLLHNIQKLKGKERVLYIRDFLKVVLTDEETLIEISALIADAVGNFKI